MPGYNPVVGSSGEDPNGSGLLTAVRCASTNQSRVIMRYGMKAGVLALAVATAGLTGCAGCDAGRYSRMMVGRPAPDFELTTLAGEKVRLSQFRGKPVLLAFFAHG